MATQTAVVHTALGNRKPLVNVSVLVFLLAVAAALDLITLFRNIPILGLGAEANPVALFILANYGPLALIVVKAGAVLFASLIAVWLARHGRARLATLMLIACSTLTALAALTNILSV